MDNKDIRKAIIKYGALNWPELGGRILTGTAVVAGVAGVTALVDVIIDYFRQRGMQSQSKEYFTKMLEAHPQLQKVDPKIVAKYWESLYHFAPYMAQDPLAAGAYITQSINRLEAKEFGGPPADTIATLTDLNKKFLEAKDIAKKPSLMKDELRKATIHESVRDLWQPSI